MTYCSSNRREGEGSVLFKLDSQGLSVEGDSEERTSDKVVKAEGPRPVEREDHRRKILRRDSGLRSILRRHHRVGKMRKRTISLLSETLKNKNKRRRGIHSRVSIGGHLTRRLADTHRCVCNKITHIASFFQKYIFSNKSFPQSRPMVLWEGGGK